MKNKIKEFNLRIKRQKEIKELRNKGLTFNKIGQILNINRTRVCFIFHKDYKLFIYKDKVGRLYPNCVVCDVDIQKDYGQRKYCSSCSTKEVSGREHTRELIRKRDYYTCQDCGKKWIEGQRRFDIHHLDGDKEKTRKYESYKELENNSITLCHQCHCTRHTISRAEKWLIT